MKRVPMLLALAGLVLGACGSDLDSETAGQLAVDNTRAQLGGHAETLAFLSESGLVGRVLPADECDPDFDPEGCSPTEPFDWSADVEALVGVLEEKVFVSGNVESEQDGVVTYLMRPAVLCADEVGDARAACEEQLTRIELRLAVTAPSSRDVDVRVLVGSARHNPLTFALHHDRLAVRVNLDDVAGALEVIAAATGETVELPEVFEGEFETALLAEGPQALTARLLVHRAVHVAQGDWELRVGAATPAVSVTVDGAAETVTGAVSFGPIDVKLPMGELGGSEICTVDSSGYVSCETEPALLQGVLALHLAGLTGATTFEAATESVKLMGLGLGDGPAVVTYAGLPFLALDVNPTAGRTFDLELAEAPNGDLDLTVSPSLELALALDLARAAQEDPGIPAWMHDEDLLFVLDGAERPALRIFAETPGVPGAPEPALEQALQVTRGRLTLDASSLAAPVVVEGGQCLFAESEPADPHPFSALQAGVCGG